MFMARLGGASEASERRLEKKRRERDVQRKRRARLEVEAGRPGFGSSVATPRRPQDEERGRREAQETILHTQARIFP